jgi:L-serine dehydratase
VKTTVLEIFKVGIGPSSSHTVGPMRAAADFAGSLASKELLLRTRRVGVELHGSLALTGPGRGTDGAILLGLCGELPDRLDPDAIDSRLRDIRQVRSLALRGVHTIPFDMQSRYKETSLGGLALNVMEF